MLHPKTFRLPLHPPGPPRGTRGVASRILVALALVTVPVASSVPARVAQAQPASDRADDLYKKGVAAFEAGDLHEAHRLLAEAWGLKKSADIAANLGIVSLKLGKMREAAEALAHAVDYFPVGASPEARAQLAELRAQAERGVAKVTVVVNVESARVDVDGRELGRSPLTGPVYVDPGQRRFTAVREGYEQASVAFQLVAGDVTTIELKLDPVRRDVAPPPPPVEEKLPVWPMIAFGGLTAVGLGVGVGFIVMSESAKSELEESGCRDATCGLALQDQVDDYNLGRNGALGGFIAGGLGAVGLVAYGIAYATSGAAETTPAKTGLTGVDFTPLVGPGVAGGALTFTHH